MAIEQNREQKVIALASAMRHAVLETELPAENIPTVVHKFLHEQGWDLIPVDHNRQFYDSED